MKFLITLFFVSLTAIGIAKAEDEVTPPPKQEWSFQGMTGTFDRGALQRGFQVYKEVCASCHGIDLLSYRNLKALGYTPDEIKAIASEYEVRDGPNDEGDMYDRKALPSDRFVNPYRNEKAARAANSGSFPPDLSLITKARPGGADYLYALLIGYTAPPKGEKLPEGMYYNKYFPGHQIAMPPPLSKGLVDYADSSDETVEGLARDVTTFLAWASEPELEDRKAMGLRVLIYVGIFTLLMFMVMKMIWRRVET